VETHGLRPYTSQKESRHDPDRRLWAPAYGEALVTTLAAVGLCVLLGALAVFQALLALGAPLGRFAWGGQHLVLPTPLRIGSAVAIAVYFLLAGTVLVVCL